MEISEQRVEEFRARMNNWVASQGLVFQLIHGSGIRGAQSTLLYWFVRMGLRILILLGIAAVVLWFYLAKRVDSAGFALKLSDQISGALGADEATFGGMVRMRGHLEISKIEMEGGADSFFDSVVLREIRTRMGLLDGVIGNWESDAIVIGRLDLAVRAGAEEEAQGARIYEGLFKEGTGFDFKRLEVKDGTIRWGYSEVTSGSIRNATIRANKSRDGWDLAIAGGLFSQNWLEDLEIIKMQVSISRDGVTIRDAEFKRGNGEVRFDAKLTGGASGPVGEGGEAAREVRGTVLEGSGRMEHLSIDSYLKPELRDLMTGQISGSFTLGGSPYGSSGVTIEADVELNGGEDEVVLRKQIDLLSAISLVDRGRSYSKVRFREGSFKMETGGRVAVFSEIDLHAKDLMRLQGEAVARRPNEKEVARAKMLERVEDGFVPEPSNSFGPTGGPAAFSLESAAKLARKTARTAVKDENTIFEFSFEAASRRLQAEADAQYRNIPQLNGVLKFGLHPKAFERSRILSEKYPLDEVSGFRWVQLFLNDAMDTAGGELAREIRERSRDDD